MNRSIAGNLILTQLISSIHILPTGTVDGQSTEHELLLPKKKEDRRGEQSVLQYLCCNSYPLLSAVKKNYQITKSSLSAEAAAQAGNHQITDSAS